MNQRFQNAEIRLVSEQYADNELYHAVSSIGQQLEAELTGFGLCPEECFMEVLELLSAVNNENDFVSDKVGRASCREIGESSVVTVSL